MRNRKLEQTITAIDITLKYHSNEFKPSCLPTISDYRQQLVRAKDRLGTFPDIWKDMDRDLTRKCEALMKKAGVLADEAEEYLTAARIAAVRP